MALLGREADLTVAGSSEMDGPESENTIEDPEPPLSAMVAASLDIASGLRYVEYIWRAEDRRDSLAGVARNSYAPGVQ